MTLPFVKIEYNGSHNYVSWQGLSLRDGNALNGFMRKEVANRLNDTPGRDEFHSHLRGLALTGMGKDSLEAVLNAGIPEERDWAVGEALAEALLIRSHGVVFPWNMARDKRNARGSLPGADIVGFLPLDSSFRLALGEVKTSCEDKYPPQVMSGRSGHLGHQIDNLAQSTKHGRYLPASEVVTTTLQGYRTSGRVRQIPHPLFELRQQRGIAFRCSHPRHRTQ